MPTHPTLTQVPRVIHDVPDVLGRPQGSYPEVLCQYLYYWLRNRLNKEIRLIVIMPTHPKLTQVPMVIHNHLDILGSHKGSYTEQFMSIYLLLAEI